MKKREKVTAAAMILTAASGWGLIGLFSRPLTAAGLGALELTWIRAVLTAAGVGLLLLIKSRALFRVRLRDFWIFLCTGLVSIVFFNVCYFFTLSQTTLATACVLLYTAPCFVMLLSALLFREKITAQKAAALVLAFVGCALASGFLGGGLRPSVLLLGLGSGLGYASYSIFGKLAMRKYHPFTLIFYTFVVAAVGLLPFVRISEIFTVLPSEPALLPDALGLGLISTVMPYLFYTGGLKHIEAGAASVMAFAEPMVASLTGIFLFREPLHWKNAAGICMIFAAIVLLNVPLGKRRSGRGESREGLV